MIEAISGGDLGSTGFKCDLAEMLYRGAPTMQTPFYRGHRDLGLMMFSGVFNYAMVGLMIQSAYVTLSQANISSWLEVQDQYEQQIL